MIVVSIRTRPTGRVMHSGQRNLYGWIGVSIRTRPTGRVMRCSGVECGQQRACFNPHPANRPGDA